MRKTKRILILLAVAGAFILAVFLYPNDDAGFSRAIKKTQRSGIPIVLGSAIRLTIDSSYHVKKEFLEPFIKHAGHGIVSFPPAEGDSGIIKTRLFFRYDKSIYKSFGLKILTRLFETLKDLNGTERLISSGLKFDQENNLYIEYPADETKRFPVYSLYKLLDGKYNANDFRDKIVLIGVTNPNSGAARDYFNTPLGYLNGVEIHGYVINTIQKHLLNARKIKNTKGIVIVSVDKEDYDKLPKIGLSPRRGVFTAVVKTLSGYKPAAMGFDILFTDKFVYKIDYYRLPVSVSIALFWALIIFINFLPMRIRLWVLNILGIKKEVVAVLLIDVCSYQKIVEHLSLHSAIHLSLLDKYKDTASYCIKKYRKKKICRIVKFEGGDSILVTFYDPVDAVNYALELTNEVHNIEISPAHEDFPYISIHTGISFGEVIRDAVDDIHGNAVNIAARLCSIAGKDEVVITPQLYEKVRDSGEFNFSPEQERIVKRKRYIIRTVNRAGDLKQVDKIENKENTTDAEY